MRTKNANARIHHESSAVYSLQLVPYVPYHRPGLLAANNRANTSERFSICDVGLCRSTAATTAVSPAGMRAFFFDSCVRHQPPREDPMDRLTLTLVTTLNGRRFSFFARIIQYSYHTDDLRMYLFDDATHRRLCLQRGWMCICRRAMCQR